MRLLRLLPEQIMAHWAPIRECLLVALPPGAESSEDNLIHIQERLLLGNIECWMAVDDLNANKTYGIMTTTFVFDVGTKVKNLLVYTISIVSDHPESMWQQAAMILKDYAKKNSCHRIIAYSNNETMIKISEQLGGNTSFRFITFDLS